MKVVDKNGLIYDCPEEYVNSFLENGWKEVSESKKAEEASEVSKKVTSKK